MTIKYTKYILLLILLPMYLLQIVQAEGPDIGLANDTSYDEITGKFRQGSHVKLFLPNLPYLAISHAINASLVRPANNDKGWQYDLATGHKSYDDKIWEFQLRQDVHFQDGTPFNADSILLNMGYFKQQPFVFTKLHTIFDRVEKLDNYTVRFYLREPYGVFLHDAIWLQFYTKNYLEKYGWNGKPTAPNLAEPGAYGLGPYILHEGYIEGDRSTPRIVLKADPDYWGDKKPKVDIITIITDLEINKAREQAIFEEGKVDIMPVPFADEVDTVLSPYAKLAVSPSMNNYAMHFNMINGDKAILDERVRYVINHAIEQEYLLNLSMLGEGMLSPTMVSPNFYRVADAIALLGDFFKQYSEEHDDRVESLRKQIKMYQKEQGLDPEKMLKLTILAQESFLFLIQDIQYFLAQVNIDLETKIVSSEKEVFHQLFGTWKGANEQHWDLLLWGNYDWYKHPWAAFFVYKPFYAWSTIPPNKKLDEYTDKLVRTNVESEEYPLLVADFIQHVYEHNYMVFLPTPNNVYAVNKEVFFNPGRSAFLYLRDLEVTERHWSVRGATDYPSVRKQPLKINHQTLQEPSI